ncbi:hypothetical protein EB835_13350 [Brevibacterium sp. S22]|nr:hypothetical protein EB835_13350 [Brevibacterium sp. S22]
MTNEVRNRAETLDPQRAENYRNTFAPAMSRLVVGDVLPAGWEGFYFPFASGIDGLRPDGTPLDDVVPDFGLPRRMYAGEDTVFHRPLRLGETVEQTESLGVVKEKNGNRGRLVFADIERTYSVGGELAIETVWHDVFLGESSGALEGSEPTFDHVRLGEEWQTSTFAPDSRHLFRFSAITFNTHRVHYDLEWAQEAERLPGLLVHGPLTRNLLLDAVISSHSGGQPATFGFTASAPLFVDHAITLAVRDQENGETEALALNDQGGVAARGIARWAGR